MELAVKIYLVLIFITIVLLVRFIGVNRKINRTYENWSKYSLSLPFGPEGTRLHNEGGLKTSNELERLRRKRGPTGILLLIFGGITFLIIALFENFSS